jgi:cytochrome c oxidase subunit 1
MIIAIIIAYVPALMDTFKYSGPGAPPYDTNNPMPVNLNDF